LLFIWGPSPLKDLTRFGVEPNPGPDPVKVPFRNVNVAKFPLMKCKAKLKWLGGGRSKKRVRRD